MYVATKELELSNRKAMPGESVPEVMHWSYSVLLAHLNMGWLKYVGDGADLHPDDRKSLSSTVTVEASEQAAPVVPKEISASTGNEKFQCGICGKDKFKNSRSLKIHVTAAHKK